jgi:hypothetical protein
MAIRKNLRKPEASRENGKLGGRPKGTPNKITLEIRTLAQKHGPEAFARIVELSASADTHAVRLAAAREILDRAYGRSPQPITGEGGEGPIQCQFTTVYED